MKADFMVQHFLVRVVDLLTTLILRLRYSSYSRGLYLLSYQRMFIGKKSMGSVDLSEEEPLWNIVPKELIAMI